MEKNVNNLFYYFFVAKKFQFELKFTQYLITVVTINLQVKVAF